MDFKSWEQWEKRPDQAERTLIDRAIGNLPEMESTKQLVKLVSEVYRDGDRVLDVGCNVGHYLKGLRKKFPKLDYTGVDAYSHYIDQAKKIFSDDDKSHFEVKNIFEPISPENSYDVVFCCNVLLHFPDFRKPVKNLLGSTKKVCFIRLLLDDFTSIVQLTYENKFDENGNPLDFRYYNTWSKKYFIDFIHGLKYNVELIKDEFDPSVLDYESKNVKTKEFDKGTRIIDGKQVIDNIITNYVWAKITPI
jgi:SAM-dependent methyltransferase